MSPVSIKAIPLTPEMQNSTSSAKDSSTPAKKSPKLPASELTAVLERWSRGDRGAASTLMPLVYDELHRLAERIMRGERSDHTLQSTALVHEAYMRLTAGTPSPLRNRVHFFSLAARVMRHVLVDHARKASAHRRGGAALKLSFGDLSEDGDSPGLAATPDSSATELLELDQAIDDLSRFDQRKARVVELRFFAGLTAAETAEALGVSVPTVLLDTRLAKAWLWKHLHGSDAS